MIRVRHVGFALAFLLAAIPVRAADLYPHDDWSALASDNRAHKVGDELTVLVYESSAASDSASTGSQSNMSLGGEASAGSFDQSAHLGLDGSSENSGTTDRSGAMVAEISVIIQEVLPNGDLRVAGTQVLNINGERTKIRVEGRVRQIDIGSANTVLSTRLADATIDYDGVGFVSRSAQPGIVTRIFRWLGLP